MATTLTDLDGDSLVHVADCLSERDVVSLSAVCRAMLQAVRLNETLWASLFARRFEAPWRTLLAAAGPYARPLGSHSWYQEYVRTDTACQQLVSTHPAVRSWAVDSIAVALAQLHGTGPLHYMLTAQQNILEVNTGSASFQLHGHNGRVSCATLLELQPGGRFGVVSGSADQTLRLWQARSPQARPPGDNTDPELRLEPPPPPAGLMLLTPARTLRGHQESITCLDIIEGSTGVRIAATGGKDRVLKLWGLAPLLPSPVHQPQIATLRGHGAPLTCMATLPSFQPASTSGQPGACPAAALVTGSLDGRCKLWDVWSPACAATAKMPAPVSLLAGLKDPLGLLPGALEQHALLAACGNAVQLLDVRSMRVAAVAAQPERAEQVLCMAQWGADVVAGGRDGGARVWDLRTSSGGGAQPRLLLREHHRAVTNVHLDRLKVVAATCEYGEAPVRVWSAQSGAALARLNSIPPPHHSRGSCEGGGGAEDAQQQQGWSGGEEEVEEEGEDRHGGWHGVTALACKGAALLTGNSEGVVCERDYRRGGLPERGWGGAPSHAGVVAKEGVEGEHQQVQLGKFWHAAAAEGQ